MLRDLYRSDSSWRIAILRYFNPAGAHEGGLIGEDPQGIPNKLMPFVAQVAIGRRDCLKVWGSDYQTPDGTGVRDYIHVVDLAAGHLKALAHLTEPQCTSINLGTGFGSSILDVINAFAKASERPVPYELAPRRQGDVAACYADPSLAETLLGWKAQKDLSAMCMDTLRGQLNNPLGFSSATSSRRGGISFHPEFLRTNCQTSAFCQGNRLNIKPGRAVMRQRIFLSSMTS